MLTVFSKNIYFKSWLKSFHILHHSTDDIFWFFGIKELSVEYPKYTVPLKDLLGGQGGGGVGKGEISFAITTAHEPTQ